MTKFQGKKVLILGANPETVSLIQKAKQMGIYTIVTDYDPNAYAKAFADKAYNVDAMDEDKLVELALEEKVDGVLVGVAEALLQTYCKVCGRLNMPCYSSLEQFDIMVRKDYFKNKCREYGVPTIDEYSLDQIAEIKYPVIVKPVDNCSSRGITICYSEEELKRAIEVALSFSPNGKYLIERYMMGDEVIQYYVMQDGNPIFAAMCDRYTFKAPDNPVQLPICYIFPSRHIQQFIDSGKMAMKNMIKGLGMDNGSIFFQSFVDEDGIVRTYEPGYRLNGAQEHMIVSQVSGVDAKEMYINLALTGQVSEIDLESVSNPKPQKLGCKLSPLAKGGKISKIRGLEEIKQLSDVVSVNPSYREGDEVTGVGTLKQVVCRFFIVSKDKKSLIDTINKIYDLLEIIDENGNDMIIGKFDTRIINELY